MATASTTKAYHPPSYNGNANSSNNANNGSSGSRRIAGSNRAAAAAAAAAAQAAQQHSAAYSGIRGGSAMSTMSARESSRRGSNAMSVSSYGAGPGQATGAAAGSSYNAGYGGAGMAASGSNGGANSSRGSIGGFKAMREVIGGKVQEIFVLDDDDDDDDEGEQTGSSFPRARFRPTAAATGRAVAPPNKRRRADIYEGMQPVDLVDDEADSEEYDGEEAWDVPPPPSRPLGLEDATYQHAAGEVVGEKRGRNGAKGKSAASGAASRAGVNAVGASGRGSGSAAPLTASKGKKRAAASSAEVAVPAPPSKGTSRATLRSAVGAARLDEAAPPALDQREAAVNAAYTAAANGGTSTTSGKRKRLIVPPHVNRSRADLLEEPDGAARKAIKLAPNDDAGPLPPPNASSTSAAASAASYAHAQPPPQLYSRQPQNLEVSYLQAQQQPQVPSQLYQRLDQPIVPLGGSGGSRTLLQSAEQIPANGGTSFRYRPRLSRGLDDQAMVKAGSANSIATPVAPSPPPSGLPTDDKEGHFIVRAGDSITGRYKILSQLGQGTFGKVVEAFDRHDRKRVAIKVIRAIQKYRDASQIEIRVLRTLSENDPHKENQCIHLLSTFSYRNHVCIVSELLGKSVFDFLKENEFHPFPATHIWSFARQLLKSVAFLHSLNLVHTDLKPENILLVDGDYVSKPISSRYPNSKRWRVLKNTEIRLIDFGSATFNNEYHSAVVSTRHYRAPEIILGMGWSFPCDAWSIGCILVEFHTGDALFQTHDNLEHLAMMEAVLGVMPDDFRRKAETYKAELFKDGRLDFPNAKTNKNSKKYVRSMRKLSETINYSSAYNKHNTRFLHLIRRLLEFDPEKRISVQEALNHPYFSLVASDFPTS